MLSPALFSIFKALLRLSSLQELIDHQFTPTIAGSIMDKNNQGSPPFPPQDPEEINSKLPPRFRSAESQHHKDKMTASKSPITNFTVGNWKRDSNLKGNLTAKFYYGMKRLVWEFLNGPLKSKMEVCWSDITAIEAVMIPNQPGFLRVQLAKPPLFFRNIPPQPQKRTTWEPADDFTNGQAQLCRKHEVTFPPGALDKHYEKLLICDARLAELSRRPFPTNEFFFALQQNPQQQLLSSVLPLQQIPQPQLSSSVFPLQHIPNQQFHHSLNSNIVEASASSNGVMGNQINNEPTFVDQSSSGSCSSVVTEEQQLSPRSRCLPWRMRRGNDKGPFMVQGTAPTDDELGLAKAILREANANCEDGAWSLLDLYRKQRQEDQCNEASSVSPDPPSKP